MSQAEYWIDAGFNAATRAHLTKAGSIVGYVQAIDQSTPDGLNLTVNSP